MFDAILHPRLTGRVAIIHATLVPMDAERLLPDHTLLVEDGRIRGLGPTSAVSAGDAHVIDASGMYAVPGLADMHVHYNDPGVAAVLLANGITRVRHMWGSPNQLALNQKVRDGTIPGPWIASTSPIIDGLGSHGQTAWPGSILLTDPTRAGALVEQFARRGYRQIKAYQWLAPAVLRALGAASRVAALRMVGHCPEGMSFEAAMDAGMSCFEHLTGVGTGHLAGGRVFPPLRDPISRRGSPETLDLLAHHLDHDAIKRLADRMAREQVWTCPTLVVWQKQVQVPEEALADPGLRYESPGMCKGWEMGLRARHAQLPIPLGEWIALARARDAALAGIIWVLHQAGAPLLLGTDAPNPFVVFGFALHQELDNLVAAGLSPFEAIRCGTADGARFLGESDDWGTITVGTQAELLLVRENPLQGVRTLRQPESVLVNGYFFDRQALDRLLEARLAQVAAPAALASHIPAFEVSRDNTRVEHEGAYVERTAGAVTGRLRSRHQRLPDGRHRVEERCVGRAGSTSYEKRVELWLEADQTVLRGELHTASWLGTERTTLERTDAGYRAGVEAIDGVRSDSTLESGPLPPSERLSATAFALCLSEPRETPLRALSVDEEALVVVTAAVTPESDAAYQVSFERSGTVVTRHYEVGADGGLSRLSGTTWMQPYELSVGD